MLPMYLLRQCVAAWDRRPVRGAFGTGGFDVADTGADANALALRVGPELYHIEKWRGSDEWTVSDSARHAGQVTVDNGISRLDYDAGGVDPIRGPIREWSRNTGQKLYANPCRFGGKVQGANVIFERARPKSITNEQYFHNWGIASGYGDPAACGYDGAVGGRRQGGYRTLPVYQSGNSESGRYPGGHVAGGMERRHGQNQGGKATARAG